MTRAFSADFAELTSFVRAYTLTESVDNPDFIRLLGAQHKRYFALLTAIAELSHQGVQPASPHAEDASARNDAFHAYLAECGSDLGSALFSWLHGNYKAARLSLRSAIENCFKAVGVIEHPHVLTTKNVHEVVNVFVNLPFFANPAHAMYASRLAGAYSDLCADVHTATVQHMEQISALGYFPNFDLQRATRLESLFRRVVHSILSVLVLRFRDQYFRMHFRNRDIVSEVVGLGVRRLLNEGSIG